MASDALDILMQDHREVEDLFTRFRNAPQPQQKRLIVERIIRELSIHAALEEQFLYPAVEEELPDGERLAREAREEHQAVKETLAELDGADPSDPGYDARVRSLTEDVEHHVREEEQEMFPKFRTAIGRKRLKAMGRAMEVGKKVAPTHPHPSVPSEPPIGAVAGVAAAAVDRTRDAARTAARRFTGAPTEPTTRTRKKSPARKATAKRAPSKKSAARKSTPKRTTAKRAPSKKSAARKSTPKRTTAKRRTVKKSPAKKSTAKRRAA